MDSRFTEVGADRFMFNPNKGCTGQLTGWLLNKEKMPDIQRGKETQEWDAFLVLTTKPSKGLDREGKVVDVPVGSMVLTPATFKLNDVFTKASVHAKLVFEVCIIPKPNKIDIGHGQTMWLYKLGVDKEHPRPREEFGLPALLAPPENARALPAGGAEAAVASGEDIPF